MDGVGGNRKYGSGREVVADDSYAGAGGYDAGEAEGGGGVDA